MDVSKAKISTLPENPACCAVYKRYTGEIYLRLNKEYHVKATPGQPSVWVANGEAVKIDPNEEVTVIYRSDR